MIRMASEPTIDQLRKATHDRPDKHDFYMWGVIRKISIYFTWMFVRTPITPNQITLLSLLFGVAGATFFSSADPMYWLAGWFVVNMHLVLDQADGETARWKKMSTKFGYFFDEITHPLVNVALFAAASVGVYAAANDVRILMVGLSLVFSAWTLRASGLYSDFISGSMFKLRTDVKSTPTGWLKRVAGIPTGLGGYFHVFAAAALLDILFSFRFEYGGFAIGSSRELFLVAAAVAIPVMALRKAYALRKRLKDSRL